MKNQVLNNNIKEVNKLLVKYKLDVNALDENRHTVLDYALDLDEKLLDMACVLLRHGGKSEDSDLLNASLRYAASEGHSEAVRLLPRVPGINVNAQDNGGQTALILAAINGHDVVVEKLLLALAGSHTSEGYVENTLMHAAANGDIEMVNELLSSVGMAVKIKDFDGKTAFDYVEEEEHNTVREKLEEARSRVVNNQDHSGKTALMYAAENGHKKIVKNFIPLSGVDINLQDKQGQNALMHAAQNYHSSVIAALLVVPGIDVNLQDSSKKTAFDLYNFTSITDARILELFLHKQASTTLRIYSNKANRIPAEIMASALRKLALAGDIDAIKHACALGYSLDGALVEVAKLIKIDVALAAAEQSEIDENKEAAKILIEQEPKVGIRVLVAAAGIGDDDLVKKLLLLENIDINAIEIEYSVHTALSHAAANDYAKVIKILLSDPRIKVNAENLLGNTALILATKNKHYDIAAQLLKVAGIDVTIKNNKKETADLDETLKYVVEQGDRTAAGVILAQDSDVGPRVLISAAGSGDDDLVKKLLKFRELDINHRGNRGVSHRALTCAAEKGHDKVVKILLADSRINVNVIGKWGSSALIWAAEEGHDNVVKTLLEDPRIDVNDAGVGGNTALISASKKGNVVVVTLLLNPNTSVTIQNNKKETAADVFDFSRCCATSLKLFLIKGAYIRQSIPENRMEEALIALACEERITAIQHAVKLGYGKLLEKALMGAAKKGNVKGVKAVLAINSDLGATALMEATEARSLIAVTTLLEAEIKAEDKDARLGFGDRKTALIAAARNGDEEIVRALVKHGANVLLSSSFGYGYSALSVAAAHNKLNVVKFLSFHIIAAYHNRAGGIFLNATKAVWGEDKNQDAYKLLDNIYYMLKANKSLASPDIYAWAEDNGHNELKNFLADDLGYNSSAEKNGRTVLTNAAFSGDSKAINKLLKLPGIVVNLKDKNDDAALILAAKQGHAVVVERLLSAPNINLNIQDHKGDTALTLASVNGHRLVVERLLQYTDIDVNIKRSNVKTAFNLFNFSSLEDSELLELFLEKDVDLRYEDDSKRIPDEIMTKTLTRLALRGNTEAIRMAFDLGYSLSAALTSLAITDSKNNTSSAVNILLLQDIEAGSKALIAAAAKGETAIVEKLLSVQGINVNYKDKDGSTALMEATSNVYVDMVTNLIKAPGININVSNFDGQTALDLLNCTEPRSSEILELFLTNGASTALRRYDDGKNFISENIMTSALISLACKEEDDVIKQVFDLGYSLHAALATAAEQNNMTAVRVLATQDPESGSRLLITASESGNDDLVQELLRVKGIDVNTENADGNTPLVLASSGGSVDVVAHLLEVGGVKVNQKALDYAVKGGHIFIANVLARRINANDINLLDSSGLFSSIDGGSGAVHSCRVSLLSARISGVASADDISDTYTNILMPKVKWVSSLMRSAKLMKLTRNHNSYMFMHILMFPKNLSSKFAEVSFAVRTQVLKFLTGSDFDISILPPIEQVAPAPIREMQVSTSTGSAVSTSSYEVEPTENINSAQIIGGASTSTDDSIGSDDGKIMSMSRVQAVIASLSSGSNSDSSESILQMNQEDSLLENSFSTEDYDRLFTQQSNLVNSPSSEFSNSVGSSSASTSSNDADAEQGSKESESSDEHEISESGGNAISNSVKTKETPGKSSFLNLGAVKQAESLGNNPEKAPRYLSSSSDSDGNKSNNSTQLREQGLLKTIPVRSAEFAAGMGQGSKESEAYDGHELSESIAQAIGRCLNRSSNENRVSEDNSENQRTSASKKKKRNARKSKNRAKGHLGRARAEMQVQSEGTGCVESDTSSISSKSDDDKLSNSM